MAFTPSKPCVRGRRLTQRTNPLTERIGELMATGGDMTTAGERRRRDSNPRGD